MVLNLVKMISLKISLRFRWFLIILAATLLKFLILIKILTEYNFKSLDSDGYILLSENFADSYLVLNSLHSDLSLLRTPGYPLFLNIFSSSMFKLISAQIVISVLISLTLVLIVRKLPIKDSNWLSLVVLILSQLETSLFVYSYKVLSEMLFVFFITVFIYLILLRNDIKKMVYIPLVSLIFLSIILVRPIGIVFIIAFGVLILISKNKKFYMLLFLISFLSISVYSFYNYSKSGVFTTSTVQNENLLMYEGVGAKSLTLGASLMTTQNDEKRLRTYKLGENPTPRELDGYNLNRGFELILENKASFIKLHVIGVGKILFGPNKYEINELFKAIHPIFSSTYMKPLLNSSILLITFLISFFGFIGACYFLKFEETKFLSVTFFTYLIFAGGASAYGRFRVPIAPILIIFAALFVNYMYRRWKLNQTNSLNI